MSAAASLPARCAWRPSSSGNASKIPKVAGAMRIANQAGSRGLFEHKRQPVVEQLGDLVFLSALHLETHKQPDGHHAISYEHDDPTILIDFTVSVAMPPIVVARDALDDHLAADVLGRIDRRACQAERRPYSRSSSSSRAPSGCPSPWSPCPSTSWSWHSTPLRGRA